MWDFIEDVVSIAMGIIVADVLVAKAPEIKATTVAFVHGLKSKAEQQPA